MILTIKLPPRWLRRMRDAHRRRVHATRDWAMFTAYYRQQKWQFTLTMERVLQFQAQATLDRIQRCRAKAGYLACECRAEGHSQCQWLARDRDCSTMDWVYRNIYGMTNSHDTKMAMEIAALEAAARGQVSVKPRDHVRDMLGL